ncbi:MAG TPA: hypothetical protein VEJ20_02265, partial [Candidatus Eremiobacteraceae bacterium]|nr:hypothetical protein [Candidatus Eremiobacteraceae bacterium]
MGRTGVRTLDAIRIARDNRRRTSWTRAAGAIAGALLCALFPTMRASAAGIPFTCSDSVWYTVATASTTQLYSLNETTIPFVFTPIGADYTGGAYNGIGYNPQDNFLYGLVSGGGGATDLLQIDSTGAVTNLGAIAGIPSLPVSGTFLPNGTFVTAVGGKIYEVDVSTVSVISSATVSVAGLTLNDLAYDPFNGDVYSVAQGAGNDETIVVNPATGAVTQTIPQSTTTFAANAGAQWIDGAGNLYLGSTAGGIYNVNLTNGNITLVSSTATANGIDAATCINTAQLEKTVNPASTEAGETVTYTYVAYNGAETADSVTFSDDLSSVASPDVPTDGVFNLSTLSVSNSSGTASLSNGGKKLTITGLDIPAMGSVTITIQATLPASLATGTYADQAVLSNLPAGLPSTILSDDPLTPAFPDPTTVSVTAAPSLAVGKVDNGPWTIGQSGAQYTITPSNVGGTATTGTITVTDTLPSNLTISSTPTGTGWSCGTSSGANVVCTSSTAIAAGSAGNPITVPVNIGAGTPTGTNSISNVASTYGGGDPV